MGRERGVPGRSNPQRCKSDLPPRRAMEALSQVRRLKKVRQPTCGKEAVISAVCRGWHAQPAHGSGTDMTATRAFMVGCSCSGLGRDSQKAPRNEPVTVAMAKLGLAVDGRYSGLV
jgi:hypothetical protein